MVEAPYYDREYRFMKRNNNPRGTSSRFPPQLTSSVIVKKKVRFNSGVSAGTSTIAANSLGDLWCFATAANAAYQIAEFVRIRKIEMWCSPPSSLVPSVISVDWVGGTPGLFGNSRKIVDTTIGFEPAHIVAKPPAGVQTGQWLLASNTANIVQIQYAAGTTIDLTYEMVVRDNASVQAVTGGVAGATIGANYVRALDSTTTGALVPVGLSTI